MNPHTPPWLFTYVSDGVTSCMFCQQTDCPVLIRRPEPLESAEVGTEPKSSLVVGVCEACAVHAHWVWRSNNGEIPPVFTDESIKKVVRVKVVIARLRPDPVVVASPGSMAQGSTVQEAGAPILKADPALVSSYDFAMISDEGAIDLPGDDLADGELEVKAVDRALEKLNVYTWAPFVEPLYKAYTPRGKLVSVVLVTAWAMLKDDFDESHWRAWPPQEWVVPGMKGFYSGFENAWALRLFKRKSVSNPTDEISVFVCEAAVRYIVLQQQLRSGKPPRDLSMLEYLRRMMTDDEKRVEAQICKLAKSAMDMKEQESEGASNMGVAGDQGLVRSGRRPSQAEQVVSTDDSTDEGDAVAVDDVEEGVAASGGEVAEEVEADAPVAKPVVADKVVPVASSSEEPDDNNDWPDDLPFKPGDEVIDAEFTNRIPEPGFVRVGRVLTTDPSVKDK